MPNSDDLEPSVVFEKGDPGRHAHLEMHCCPAVKDHGFPKALLIKQVRAVAQSVRVYLVIGMWVDALPPT
jgi:hypothetical protein